jgi:hypothetical protein
MILHGNQRGGARDLALHLLKEENEHVEIHELRGFVSENLVSALNEAYAVSRGTKARQFLFSLSLNPPKTENVKVQDFEDAINQVEEKLGLKNQPRIIVFHEKKGRRHAHAVWSRTDMANMKAIQLSHTKLKLKEISRELYLKHGWQIPRGFQNSQERDPKNFTMSQWQHARRAGKDPREIKAALQESWATTNTQSAFRKALADRGYVLAKGDRRGFVALDHRCEVFSISNKWIGVSAKEVRARLSDESTLPSVEDAKVQIAQNMANRMVGLRQEHETAVHARVAKIEDDLVRMTTTHKEERRLLETHHNDRWQAEVRQRQGRFNRGIRGILDRVTGRHRQLRAQNEREALLAHRRDQQEKDQLIFSQLAQRRALDSRIDRLQSFSAHRKQSLADDLAQYQDIQRGNRAAFEPGREGPNRGPKNGLEPQL